MKILGVSRTQFRGSDGNMISGLTFWIGEDFPSDHKYGCGTKAEKVFLIDAKAAEPLASVGGRLADFIGRDVRILYNKYGKVALFELC